MSARPQARTHPTTVAIGLSRSAAVEVDDSGRSGYGSSNGYASSSGSEGGGGGGGRSPGPDLRWREGTTTKSTYRGQQAR